MLNKFIIWPEFMLVMLALSSQLAALFSKSNYTKRLILATTIVVSGLILLMLVKFVTLSGIGFDDSFVVTPFANMAKILVLSLTMLNIVAYHDFCKVSGNLLKTEFVTLMLLSTVGIFIAISAHNFLLLFCGLELQALSGYALAAFNKDSIKSSEAGLKYFILGALLSAIALFGTSLIYGFGGSLQYDQILAATSGSQIPVGLMVGLLLTLSGLFFKLSAAPLHMWTPDVYEGAGINAVSYFATVQKIGVLVVLFNITSLVAKDFYFLFAVVIKVTAALSMIIGALGAIMQNSIKRLMAYSTVLNVGYVLIGVSLNSKEGNFAAFLYMLIYVVGVLGFFACLIAAIGRKSDDLTFEDIAGIAQGRKAMAAAIVTIMFSMIGLPPLAGFFGKYYIFYQAIAEGEVMLAVLGITTSIIAAFYYLKIVKIMYFTEKAGEIIKIPTSHGLLIITSICVAFIVSFSILPIDKLQSLISS